MTTARNIVLLTVDSLRADCCGFLGESLGGLGGDESLTPALDRLASEDLVFENAIAPGPRTPSSIPSVVTGEPLRPMDGWSYDDWRRRRSWIARQLERHPTIPARLAARGYSTAAFTANPWTSYDTRFDDGFDEFYELSTKSADVPVDGSRIPLGIRVADKVLRTTGQGHRINWNNKRDWFLQWPGFSEFIVDHLDDLDEPYFAWIFLLGPHEPYIVPREFCVENSVVEMYYAVFRHWYRRRRWYQAHPDRHFPSDESLPNNVEIRLRRSYRDAVRSVDAFVEALRPAIDDDALVVHADHGEAFGEHGTFGHQPQLYEENIHVPLVVHGTGTSRRIRDPISLRQIPALISAIASDDGPVSPTAFTSEFVVSSVERGDELAVRGRRWKYIDGNGGDELYDLLTDPGERVNRVAEPERLSKYVRSIADTYRSALAEKTRISAAGRRAVRHGGTSL